MPNETPPVTKILPSTGPIDQELGSVAFLHLLDQHPRRLTLEQLDREIGCEDRDELQRAIEILDEACLLERHDGALIPSPAALRFDKSV